MNAERYIRQATRGLWGQPKRDAQTELRGAIEDKFYRYTLLGFDEHDALQAALRDLGNPSMIARELSSVHSLPPIVKFGLLAGLTGLLSFQAAAKMPVLDVTPAPLEVRQKSCDLGAARIKELGENFERYAAQQVKRYGSRARAEAECLKNTPNPARFIRVSDLKAALRAGGLKVYEDDLLSGRIAVDFKGDGNWTTITPYDQTLVVIGKESYVDGAFLLMNLLQQTTFLLGLHGTRNPTLTLGAFKVQLGTDKQPLRTSDLLNPLLAEHLKKVMRAAAPPQPPFENVAWAQDDRHGVPTAVPGADGTLYATLENQAKCYCREDDNNARFLLMTLHEAEAHKIRGPYRTPQGLARRVNSTAEFFAGRAGGQRVFLLYRVETSNLRDIKLNLIPGAWK